MSEKVTLKITLNGTDSNVWQKWGLQQNPFPQLARRETDAAERQINSLDGDPITGQEDIRSRLKGFSEEFIDVCIKMYKPGQRVSFIVTFPEERT